MSIKPKDPTKETEDREKTSNKSTIDVLEEYLKNRGNPLDLAALMNSRVRQEEMEEFLKNSRTEVLNNGHGKDEHATDQKDMYGPNNVTVNITDDKGDHHSNLNVVTDGNKVKLPSGVQGGQLNDEIDGKTERVGFIFDKPVDKVTISVNEFYNDPSKDKKPEVLMWHTYDKDGNPLESGYVTASTKGGKEKITIDPAQPFSHIVFGTPDETNSDYRINSLTYKTADPMSVAASKKMGDQGQKINIDYTSKGDGTEMATRGDGTENVGANYPNGNTDKNRGKAGDNIVRKNPEGMNIFEGNPEAAAKQAAFVEALNEAKRNRPLGEVNDPELPIEPTQNGKGKNNSGKSSNPSDALGGLSDALGKNADALAAFAAATEKAGLSELSAEMRNQLAASMKGMDNGPEAVSILGGKQRDKGPRAHD